MKLEVNKLKKEAKEVKVGDLLVDKYDTVYMIMSKFNKLTWVCLSTSSTSTVAYDSIEELLDEEFAYPSLNDFKVFSSEDVTLKINLVE